jgi:hypothetical protein
MVSRQMNNRKWHLEIAATTISTASQMLPATHKAASKLQHETSVWGHQDEQLFFTERFKFPPDFKPTI